MIHKRWILAEGNRWSTLERAPKCDLCDDLCIREFIQNTFLMEVTKSIHLTGFINLTRGCRPQLELYLCFGSETWGSPHPPQFTAKLYCYHSKLQTQLSVTSEKCVYGLLTSRDGFQSLGVSFHFQVSAQVNTAIRALTICWDSPLLPSAKKQRVTHVVRSQKEQSGRERGIVGAPCWLRCTGRRTSVCLTGLHIPSGRSSVCSHARPELQEEERVSK